MWKEYRIVILNLAFCVLFFALGIFFSAHARAQVPGLPYQIYGSVVDQNNVPLKDERVGVSIRGVVVASSITNSEGVYGLAPTLLIIPDEEGNRAGETITFAVNGASVAQTSVFKAGVLENIALTVPGVVNPISAAGVSGIAQNEPVQQISTNSPLSVQVFVPKGLTTDNGKRVATTSGTKFAQKTTQIKQKTLISRLSYEHSGIFGTIAGVLVLTLLGWVYYQNHLFKRCERLHF